MSFSLIILILICARIECKNEDEIRALSIEYLYPTSKTSPYCSNITCVNVVHTTAAGPHDDLHYIYSTLGAPSVLAVKTSKNASLKINWENFLSTNISEQEKSISFDGKATIFSSAMLLFNRLLIFDDPKDKAKLNDTSVDKLVSVGMDELYWMATSQSVEDIFSVEFASKMKAPNNRTQEVVIKFKAATGLESSALDLPHLLLNDNLTQIDVALDDVYYDYFADDDDGDNNNNNNNNNNDNDDNNNVNITKPRIAMEMMLLTPKALFQSSVISIEKSLDDELSPGAFRTVNWLSNEKTNDTKKSSLGPGAFAQWKPICYTDPAKSITSITSVAHYDINYLKSVGNNDTVSMATGFYGLDYLDDGMDAAAMNVSFGAAADKFYSNTRYIAWQLTFGIGDHPQNGISTLTILIIAIGLGIPVLFLLISAIYLPIRSCCLRRRRGYEELSSSYPQIA